MGNATYYNQKDRERFPEGWFGKAGQEMKARKGSLTLQAIHTNQARAFEPYATHSTMPSGKAPGKVGMIEPGYSDLIRGPLMKKGEEYWKEDLDAFFTEYGDTIRDAAREHGVDERLLRAVLREEKSHRLPYLESEFMERAGFGKTVGPGQIHAPLWGPRLDLTRSDLHNPETNIRAAAQIMRNATDTLRQEGKPLTPEWIGSRYNYGNAASPTEYGTRIKSFYERYK